MERSLADQERIQARKAELKKEAEALQQQIQNLKFELALNEDARKKIGDAAQTENVCNLPKNLEKRLELHPGFKALKKSPVSVIIILKPTDKLSSGTIELIERALTDQQAVTQFGPKNENLPAISKSNEPQKKKSTSCFSFLKFWKA